MDKETPPRSFAAKAFEDLKNDCSTAQAMDDFESALIVAYEQAVQSGVRPHCALAVMLNVASSEALRLSASPSASAPNR